MHSNQPSDLWSDQQDIPIKITGGLRSRYIGWLSWLSALLVLLVPSAAQAAESTSPIADQINALLAPLAA